MRPRGPRCHGEVSPSGGTNHPGERRREGPGEDRLPKGSLRKAVSQISRGRVPEEFLHPHPFAKRSSITSWSNAEEVRPEPSSPSRVGPTLSAPHTTGGGKKRLSLRSKDPRPLPRGPISTRPQGRERGEVDMSEHDSPRKAKRPFKGGADGARPKRHHLESPSRLKRSPRSAESRMWPEKKSRLQLRED